MSQHTSWTHPKRTSLVTEATPRVITRGAAVSSVLAAACIGAVICVLRLALPSRIPDGGSTFWWALAGLLLFPAMAYFSVRALRVGAARRAESLFTIHVVDRCGLACVLLHITTAVLIYLYLPGLLRALQAIQNLDGTIVGSPQLLGRSPLVYAPILLFAVLCEVTAIGLHLRRVWSWILALCCFSALLTMMFVSLLPWGRWSLSLVWLTVCMLGIWALTRTESMLAVGFFKPRESGESA